MNGNVQVYNENFFIDLSRYRADWNVEVNGRSVLSGTVPAPDVCPQKSASLNLGFNRADILAAAGIDDLSSEDVYLNVRWLLGRADGILPASSVVAYDQICINESGIVAPTNLSGRPEIIRKEGKRILMGGQMPYKGLHY